MVSLVMELRGDKFFKLEVMVASGTKSSYKSGTVSDRHFCLYIMLMAGTSIMVVVNH